MQFAKRRYSGEDPGTLVTKPPGVTGAISKTNTGMGAGGGATKDGEESAATARVAINRQYPPALAHCFPHSFTL